MFDYSPLLSFGVSLALTTALIYYVVHFLNPSIVKEPLSHSLDLQTVQQEVVSILKMLLLWFTALLFAASPSIIWLYIRTKQKKKKGISAIPLPTPNEDLKEQMVIAALILLVLLPCYILIIKQAAFTFEDFYLFPAQAVQKLINTFCYLLVCTSLVCIIGGIVQLSLYKIQLFKHLSLTDTENTKEQKLHGQSPTKQLIRNG